MRKGFVKGTIVLLFLALAVPAIAHHSFSAVYDGAKVLNVKGTVTKIEWVNPHIYISVDVKDQKGKVTTWALEGPTTRRARDAGVSRNFIEEALNQTVDVFGYPAKDGHTQMFLKKMVFKDGHFFAWYHDILDRTGIGDVPKDEKKDVQK